MIDKISELFLQYGIKSLSMDDIARELGISKKTLYHHFKDKKDVVMQVVTHAMESLDCKMSNIIKENSFNAIDILFFVSKEIAENRKNMNPNINFDLQKYYPDAWLLVSEHRKKHIFGKIYLNTEQGVKEGLYRDDFNIGVIAKLYEEQVNHLFLWGRHSLDVSFDEILETVFVYHIRGIASQKGLEYLEMKLKSIKS